MKYTILLFVALLSFSCQNNDKQREDVPGQHGLGAEPGAAPVDTFDASDTATHHR